MNNIRYGLVLLIPLLLFAGCLTDSGDKNTTEKLYPDSDTVCFIKVTGSSKLNLIYNRSQVVIDSTSHHIGFQFLDDKTFSSLSLFTYDIINGIYYAGLNISNTPRISLARIQINDILYLAENKDAWMKFTIEYIGPGLICGKFEGYLISLEKSNPAISISGSFSAPFPDDKL